MRYQQVKAHHKEFPLSWMCSALKLSKAAYYRWDRGVECRRRREDRMLLPRIRASWEASDRTYGSPRIRKDLVAEEIPCGKRRIARIMRENSIRSIPNKRFRHTTDSAHSLPVARNVLERNHKKR